MGRAGVHKACSLPSIDPCGAFPWSQVVILSITSSIGTRLGPFSAHSHNTKVRQPLEARAESATASLLLFSRIFADQKAVRVAGSLNIGQSWPCQKHPFTKMTALNLVSVRSGRPGRSLRCRRNLNPCLWRTRLKDISGAVFAFRIRLMFRARWSSSAPT